MYAVYIAIRVEVIIFCCWTTPSVPGPQTLARAMIPSNVAAVAQLLLIVVYPGYLTFKTLEHDRKKPDAQRGWCIYWAVASAWLAMLPAFDYVFDARVALYRECKVRATRSRVSLVPTLTVLALVFAFRSWCFPSTCGTRGGRARSTSTTGFSRRFSSRANPSWTTRWRRRLNTSVERSGRRTRGRART